MCVDNSRPSVRLHKKSFTSSNRPSYLRFNDVNRRSSPSYPRNCAFGSRFSPVFWDLCDGPDPDGIPSENMASYFFTSSSSALINTHFPDLVVAHGAWHYFF